MSRTKRYLLRTIGKIAEPIFIRRRYPGVVGPIFIVGPPRSGTTLLYQLLLNSFELSCLTNIHQMLPSCPLFTSWLFRRRIQQHDVTRYGSNYGKIDGLFAPSEAGFFWYRWYRRAPNLYSPSDALSTSKRESLKTVVAGLQAILGSPILFKNTFNSMRIGSLIDAFPDAVFVVCKRDPTKTAESILVGRERHMGDRSKWMGVTPREYSQICEQSIANQCVDQVLCVERQIDTDRQKFGADRFIDVDYDRVCQAPQETVVMLSAFLEKRGIHIRGNTNIPSSFDVKTSVRVCEEDSMAIRARLEEWLSSESPYKEFDQR